MIVVQIIAICLLVYFGYTTLYALVFFLGGVFYRDKKFKSLSDKKRFCVLIPSYKEDSVIVGVAQAALKQNYPADKYRVVVIADSLQDDPRLHQALERLWSKG